MENFISFLDNLDILYINIFTSTTTCVISIGTCLPKSFPTFIFTKIWNSCNFYIHQFSNYRNLISSFNTFNNLLYPWRTCYKMIIWKFISMKYEILIAITHKTKTMILTDINSTILVKFVFESISSYNTDIFYKCFISTTETISRVISKGMESKAL